MGILDDFQFDPSTFAGAPAGWLGPLLQPQSGPGFVQSPAQLPPYLAPMSGGAAFPVAADGKGPGPVATPQSGGGGFAKEPGASNPFTDFLSSFGNGIGNAFFPSAVAPAGPQAAPSLLDRLSAGATNFATGGSPIAGVLNSVRGLATGERTDPAGIRQANQMATFNALVGAGVAPQFAQVAALNPEILKTVVAAHFNALSPQKTGTPGVAPGASASGSAAPQSSITGRAEVEAGGSQPTAEAGQDSGFAGRASPAIAGGLAVPRPPQAVLANQPVRPLDARLATLRRLLLSGPAVLPRVPTAQPPR
jgi:hypothetical protein